MPEISQNFSPKPAFPTTHSNGKNNSDSKVSIKANQPNAMWNKPIHLSLMAMNIKVTMVD